MGFDDLGVTLRGLLTYFSENYKKFLLVLLMLPAVYLVDKMEFPKIDAFIRDSLQFLNSSDEVDKRIVTVNVDTFTGKFKKPFSTVTILDIVSNLKQNGAASIVLLFEPRDLQTPESLFKALRNETNVFIDLQRDTSDYAEKSYTEHFPRFVNFDTTSDSTIGAKDRKFRRAMLGYKDRGESPTFTTARLLGLAPLNPNVYHYSFDLWETKQAYIKTYKSPAFGFYNSANFQSNQISGKVILLGSFDEWSKLASPSVFDIIGRPESSDIRKSYFPYQSKVANLLNFHVTGNYVKLAPFNDIILISLLFLFLILSNFSSKNKIFVLLSIIPICCLSSIIIYLSSSMYIDLSRTIGCFFFVQYLALPIMFFKIFKEQESKRFEEINSTRIDSLLLVSEKVAHDIRSPLSAVNLMLSRVNFESDEQREIVKNSLRRIDDVAEKILVKYKSTTGTNYEHIEKFDLLHVANALIAEKKIVAPSITYLITSGDCNICKGHRLELERVLSNVIDNSIQAVRLKASPTIEIQVSQKRDGISISVLDNGEGIPEEILKLLGSKPVSSKASGPSGNGIALLHAKRIVERMNGTLDISSQMGLGTKVTIVLSV
jgi:signal transduction histidine kinase